MLSQRRSVTLFTTLWQLFWESTDFCFRNVMPQGPIHTKDARFFLLRKFCCGYIKTPYIKWGPLADDVLDVA